MLLRYLADRFNVNGDPRTLTRKLAAGPDTGTVNLAKAAGVPARTITITRQSGGASVDPNGRVCVIRQQ